MSNQSWANLIARTIPNLEPSQDFGKLNIIIGMMYLYPLLFAPIILFFVITATVVFRRSGISKTIELKIRKCYASVLRRSGRQQRAPVKRGKLPMRQAVAEEWVSRGEKNEAIVFSKIASSKRSKRGVLSKRSSVSSGAMQAHSNTTVANNFMPPSLISNYIPNSHYPATAKCGWCPTCLEARGMKDHTPRTKHRKKDHTPTKHRKKDHTPTKRKKKKSTRTLALQRLASKP